VESSTLRIDIINDNQLSRTQVLYIYIESRPER
jgi:hypothetical protein